MLLFYYNMNYAMGTGHLHFMCFHCLFLYYYGIVVVIITIDNTVPAVIITIKLITITNHNCTILLYLLY